MVESVEYERENDRCRLNGICSYILATCKEQNSFAPWRRVAGRPSKGYLLRTNGCQCGVVYYLNFRCLRQSQLRGGISVYFN